MATRRVASRRPSAPAARVPERRRRLDRVVSSVWFAFADADRLLWSAVLTASGLVALAVLLRPGTRAGLEAAAKDSVLVHRLYTFFELYRPLSSWWLVLLAVVTALIAVACLVELRGAVALALALGRRVSHKPVSGSLVAAARRATASLGDGASVGVGNGALYVTRTSRSFRAGIAVLCLSALACGGAAVVERSFGVAGEILVSPGDTIDRVETPGPMGQVQNLPLGFGLAPIDIATGGEEAKLKVVGGRDDGRTLDLSMGGAATVGGTRLTLRAARPASGGERFRMTVTDLKTKTSREVAAGESGSFTATENGKGPTFEVLGWSKSFKGLGPAVRIQEVDAGGARQAFWVFERYPDFDAHDRATRFALKLDGVERRYDVILAATRHPGRTALLAAAGLLLLGLGLCFSGRRSTCVVRLREGGVDGAPGGDAAVEKAVRAARAS